MAGGFPGFPHETLRFLSQLKRNNTREWFLAHKDVYEQKVKGPMVELVQALGGAIQAFAPEMVVDPKRVIYRIHRDTRFSPDKTPYKTHIAALFTPRGIPKHAGAALYLHIAPEEILIGGGVYMPGTAELRSIRRHIADNSEELRTILNRPDFKRRFAGLEGDRLVRAPKDFPPDHPAIDLLRYKQFLVSVVEPSRLAETPKLFPRVIVLFASMSPLVRFLNAPLLQRGPRIPESF